MCKASSTIPHLLWMHFGPDAGWRRTRWTHESYMEFLRAAGLMIPPLLLLVVGFRLECIMVDVLHCVDQGVASHLIGNVLWHVATRLKKFGGATQGAQVANLHEHMKKWYKATKCKSQLQGKLTVERLRASGKWPKLKAKAAATRHLAGYALSLALEFCCTTSQEDRAIVGVCQLLVQFYAILDSESQFLNPTAKMELPKLGQRLVGLYSFLAGAAAGQGDRMWKLSPKLHLFQHLCEWQSVEFGNPRYYWTYSDEDLAGSMAEVSETCHPATMSSTALFKWVHLFFSKDE